MAISAEWKTKAVWRSDSMNSEGAGCLTLEGNQEILFLWLLCSTDLKQVRKQTRWASGDRTVQAGVLLAWRQVSLVGKTRSERDCRSENRDHVRFRVMCTLNFDTKWDWNSAGVQSRTWSDLHFKRITLAALRRERGVGIGQGWKWDPT